MRNKKGTTPVEELIFIIARITIALTIIAIVSTNYFASAELKDKVDNVAFFERARSVINSLDSAESGEIAEAFSKPVTVEIKTDKGRKILSIGEKSSEVSANIADSKVTSTAIKFVKERNGHIEVKPG